MSEGGNKKTLSLARPARRLEQKRSAEQGQVRQSFSGGRAKTVQVEVRKKRTVARAGASATVEASPPPLAEPVSETPPSAPASETLSLAQAEARSERDEPRLRHVLPTLSDAEKMARARAVENARIADAEARQRVEEESRRRAAQEERLRGEREAAEQRRLEEENRKRIDEEARRRAEEEAERRLAEQARQEAEQAGATDGPERAGGRPAAADAADDERAGRVRRTAARPRPGTPRARTEPRRRAGKLTVSEALDDSRADRTRSLASVRRQRERQRQQELAGGVPGKIVRDVTIPEVITVQELANRMAERGVDVVRSLMGMGVMANINQSIDSDTAELVVTEFGHRPKQVSEADVEIGLRGDDDSAEDLQPRPPVVTVMGHVDHGKTSLLDAIRETDVAGGEAGGITQHIGAYQVRAPSGQRITFIDTPGHEAFTAMRARGASVTDLVILVVAADDGVMPQTIEAINHAKAAAVPMIVAVNKIDRPDANPDRVTQELLQHEVVSEALGGDVQIVPVSALQKTNLEALEEAVLLQAEVLELKANPDRTAEGVVVEARLDRGRGVVATVLVARGTLRVGDIVVAGGVWGRVRAMLDSRGENQDSAGPAMPVEILGLGGTPMAGDEFTVVDSEARAREVTEYRQRQEREKRTVSSQRGTIEDLFTQIKEGEAERLPVVIKADVRGSLEAIVAALEKLGTDEVLPHVLHAGVGAVTESDVTLAAASQGFIIGFNVRAVAQARESAKRDGVDIRYYSIIYELVDDIKAMLSGLLAPEIREKVIATADVLEVFGISKLGRVAGCKISNGTARRDARLRLLRDDMVVHDGRVRSLKRFRDDVREVREGNECGIAIEGYQDIQQGDSIEFYEVEEVERSL